jgi:hypothetical protein
VTAEHLNRNAEDARQEGIEVKLLGQAAGELQQVIALSDTEIG